MVTMSTIIAADDPQLRIGVCCRTWETHRWVFTVSSFHPTPVPRLGPGRSGLGLHPSMVPILFAIPKGVQAICGCHKWEEEPKIVGLPWNFVFEWMICGYVYFRKLAQHSIPARGLDVRIGLRSLFLCSKWCGVAQDQSNVETDP